MLDHSLWFVVHSFNFCKPSPASVARVNDAMLCRVDGLDVLSPVRMALLVNSLLLLLTTIFDFPRSIAGRSSSCGHPAAGKLRYALLHCHSCALSTMRKVSSSGILRNGIKRAGVLRDLVLRCELPAKGTALKKRVRCDQRIMPHARMSSGPYAFEADRKPVLRLATAW